MVTNFFNTLHIKCVNFMSEFLHARCSLRRESPDLGDIIDKGIQWQ